MEQRCNGAIILGRERLQEHIPFVLKHRWKYEEGIFFLLRNGVVFDAIQYFYVTIPYPSFAIRSHLLPYTFSVVR